MKLTNKQKRYLRGLAHKLEPVVYIGQNGFTEAVIKEINTTLAAHELIKVKVRCEDQKQMAAIVTQITDSGVAELIQVVGHTAVLFKASDEPKIELPRS